MVESTSHLQAEMEQVKSSRSYKQVTGRRGVSAVTKQYLETFSFSS